MTDEDIAETLSRIERSGNASTDAVDGPFTVFNARASDDSPPSSAVNPPIDAIDSNLDLGLDVDGMGSEESECTEEIQNARQDFEPTQPEFLEAATWTDLQFTPWASDFNIETFSSAGLEAMIAQPKPPEMAVSFGIQELASTRRHSSDSSEASSVDDVPAQLTEAFAISRLPMQIDHRSFSPSKRSSTANMLIHHYAAHMVHLMQPIIHRANPFERIYLPLAIRGSSDLEQRISSDTSYSPRVAVCHSLLSAAAHNLQGLGSGEDDLQGTACYHKQKALVTLRSALASRSSAYKDLMTAILALVSVDILNGGTQDHWIHLDAAMQLQASRHFANVISAETRQLNTICSMLHLFAQTARLAPEPKPWTGSYDISNGAGPDFLSPSVEYIYGISKPTANALLKTFTLSQHLAYYEDADYPETLMQACEDLGDELCSSSTTAEEFSAIGSEQLPMLPIARAQARAFHHAAMIYYYRSIQKCGKEDLHSEQQAVLAAMQEAESLKRRDATNTAVPAPISWPAFIASCEAVGQDRVSWRDWWQQIQRYKMENYAKQQDIVLKVWAELDDSSPSLDWREILCSLGIRVLPV